MKLKIKKLKIKDIIIIIKINANITFLPIIVYSKIKFFY